MTRQLFINVYPGDGRGYWMWGHPTLIAAKNAMGLGCLYRLHVTYKPMRAGLKEGRAA